MLMRRCVFRNTQPPGRLKTLLFVISGHIQKSGANPQPSCFATPSKRRGLAPLNRPLDDHGSSASRVACRLAPVRDSRFLPVSRWDVAGLNLKPRLDLAGLLFCA
jgi:hypothetical protein